LRRAMNWRKHAGKRDGEGEGLFPLDQYSARKCGGKKREFQRRKVSRRKKEKAGLKWKEK